MKLPWRSALIVSLALLAHGMSARAGPFGLFTAAKVTPGCVYCMTKPYNAFTPIGYNPQLHAMAPIGVRLRAVSSSPGTVIAGNPAYSGEYSTIPFASGGYPVEGGAYASGPVDMGYLNPPSGYSGPLHSTPTPCYNCPR